MTIRDKWEKFVVYVDNGGTFTDSIIVDSGGNVVSGKALTTPAELAECFVTSIHDAARKMGKSVEDILSNCDVVGYGTTLGTNILVTGSGGPKLGFITTKGHEDKTIIGRLRVAGLTPIEAMHRVTADPPKPLIPRPMIRGITERIDFFGDIIIPLHEDEVRQAVSELLDEGAEGILIGLLWSVLNPTHEQRVREIVHEMASELPCCLSSEVVSTVREYPRYMSGIINLHVGKALQQLLTEIKARLKTKGYTRPLLVMQAAGGVARSEIVKPATTLHSGPVGGLMGVDFLKSLKGYKSAIGSDVGGTSFDISISPPQGIAYVREPIVGRFQIATPMCEIFTIGAGGGTIALIEPITKTLRVGPRSAGGMPGPVCYDHGGTECTVTDTDVVMNRINADNFLGGKMKLNRDKALVAVREKIADPLRIGVYDACEAICKIIDGTMQAALRSTIAIKGIDCKETMLVVFGGSGATHCAGYAAGLDFAQVIVPRHAAVFSAFGASTAPVRHRYDASLLIWIPNIPYNEITLRFELDKILSLEVIPDWAVDRFNKVFQGFDRTANADMQAEGFKSQDVNKSFEMLARYGGQLWETRCTIPANQLNSIEDLRAIIYAFEEAYISQYSALAMAPRGGIEIVSVAMLVTGQVTKPSLIKHDYIGRDASSALVGERDVYFDGNWVRTRVYDMNGLQVGNEVEGPAIIEAIDTTAVIPYGHKVVLDEYLNMIMEHK